MSGSHQPLLVALALFVAVLASYTALELANRVTLSRGGSRLAWLVAGAVALGTGIWSMHFVGMLAFRLPVTMSYDVPLVVLSALVAIAASALALFVISRRKVSGRRFAVAALFMGLAIAGMHYIGMAALHVTASLTYDPLLVAASVAVAIGASYLALRLAFRFRYGASGPERLGKLASAGVMGAGIFGMHYTAVAAAQFGAPASAQTVHTHLIANSGVAAGVVVATLVVLGTTLIAALLDRWRRAVATETATLRQSEERLRTFMDSLGFGVVVQDAGGVITHANPAASELLGLTLEQMQGLTSADPHWRITREDGTPDPPENHPVSRARLTGEPVRGVVQGVYSGAENERWILTDAVPLKDPSGAVREAIVSFVDISERRRVERALEREREFLTAMLDNIADGIVACNAEGVLTMFNQAAQDFHGLPLTPVPPERWAEFYDLYHADGKTKMAPHEVPLYRALQGEVVRNSSMVIASKRGKPRALVASGQALYSSAGEKLGAVVAMHDVTERQAAEGALRESENRFRTMADTAPVFIWLVEPESGATYFNKGWLEFTGRTLEEEQGEGWLASVHPEDQARVQRLTSEAVAAHREFEVEYRLRRADGVYRWLADRGVPRSLPDGSFAGYIGSATDITRRKEAEERLRESEERYRTLFGSIDEGFCIIEMIFDSAKKPVDYLFAEVNPAFERMTGLKEAVGKTALGLVPNLEPWWAETYGRVALTGDAVSFENRSEALGRWFDVHASRVGGESSRQVALVFTDITERKEGEERLRHQHALVKAITDNASSALFMMDRRGHPTFMNPAAERITGYTLDEIKDAPLHYAVHHTHPDGRPFPMEDCPIDRASSELRPIRHHEDVFVRKDGSFFPIVGHIAPLEQGGETVGAVIEFRDVSEIKQAEAERFRLADHLQLLLESTSEGIYGIGADGRCTFINHAGAKLLGYRADEIIGQNIHRLIHHSHADGSTHHQEDCPIYTTARDGQHISVEDDIFWRRDGTALPVEYSAAPIKAEGAIQGAVVTFSDITARKQAALERDELLERERESRILAETASRRLSFLAEASTVLASSLDYEATLQSVARLAVPDMADWCAIDILGDDGALQRLALHHKDPDKLAMGRELQERYPPRQDAEHGVSRVLRTGRAELLSEVPEDLLRLSAQNDEHYRLLRGMGLRSAIIVPLTVRNRPIGTLTFVLAESPRRYGESDLELAGELARRAAIAVDNARLFEAAQELNESLEQRVAVRTEQLEQTNRELESFAYAVSHDLRTPLSGIDGFAQALQEDYGSTLEATAAYYLGRIQHNTRRMGQLIDDILKLSRVSRHELKLSTVDLSALAAGVAENLRGRYPDPQPSFGCEKGLVVEGDEGLLRIVLENLLDNAWKFSSQSGGAQVEFGRTEQAGESVYFVRDTGAGFDMLYAHQLFQPFHRLHQESRFKGTGIGLVTVKRIVERHGGRIWAEAEVGRGATFFFTLDPEKTVELT